MKNERLGIYATTQSIDHYFYLWSNNQKQNKKATKSQQIDKSFESILQEKLNQVNQ